uniref:Nuclear hormone receptor HR96 n=1 Tax=Schistocephalus solidus TaxID=70667 RepID=A0A0X3NJD6_SCHSO
MNCPVQDKNNQKADLENRGSFFVRHKNEKSCAVCGDHAVGYNFGAIACESCKAFFRRNALRPTIPPCLFSGKCSIQVKTRRFCSPCRLEKCFAVGMRKSCIMDEKAKIERREKILRNRERKTANRAHGLDAPLQHQQHPPSMDGHGYLDNHLTHHQQQLNVPLSPNFPQHPPGPTLDHVHEEDAFHASRQVPHLPTSSHNRPSQTPHPTCDRTPYNLSFDHPPACRCSATSGVPWNEDCAFCMPPKGSNAGQQTLSNCDLGMSNYLGCVDGSVLSNPPFPGQVSGLYEESRDLELQPPSQSDNRHSHALRELTTPLRCGCRQPEPLINRPAGVIGDSHTWSSTLQSESSSVSVTGPLEESTLAGSASVLHPRSVRNSAESSKGLALYSRPSPVTNVLDGHVWTSEPEERSNKECVTLCPSLMRSGMARLLSKDQWTALNDLRSAYDSSFLISETDHTPENSCTLTLSSLVNTSGFLVRKFINFAKKLADFNVLGQEGQVCLLKGVVLNALFIRSASHYDVVRDCWVTPKGDIPTRILKVATGLENLYEEHAKYCRNFSNVVENDSHLVALMQVLCLFAPDRRSLVDRQSVSNIYDRYILLLKHYLEARHGFTRGRTLLASVLTNLAELETLTDNYGHILLHVDPSKVDPLILDVFNLSRRAASPQSALANPSTSSTSRKDTGEGAITPEAEDREEKDLTRQHDIGLGTPNATDTSQSPLTHSLIKVSKS